MTCDLGSSIPPMCTSPFLGPRQAPATAHVKTETETKNHILLLQPGAAAVHRRQMTPLWGGQNRAVWGSTSDRTPPVSWSAGFFSGVDKMLGVTGAPPFPTSAQAVPRIPLTLRPSGAGSRAQKLQSSFVGHVARVRSTGSV